MPEDEPETPYVSSFGSTSSVTKSDLLDCFDSIHATGSVAKSYLHDNFPNPGLAIEGLGVIGLPLSVPEAERIFQHYQLEPSEKTSKTPLSANSPSARVVSIDASKITLKNSIWSSFFQNVLKRIIRGLGADTPISQVRADLRGLSLSEADAIVKADTGTMNEPGKFAELMIALPSKHAGGLITITYNQSSKYLDIAPDSEFCLRAVAWYTDVTKVTHSISSGCRLALSCDLILECGDGTSESAAWLDNRKRRLRKVLSNWFRSYSGSIGVLYKFEHNYSTEKLNTENMLGHDEVVIKLLSDVGPSTGWYAFLGQVEHTKNRSDEFDDDDWDDTQLKDIYTVEGRRIGSKLEVEEEEFLQDHQFPEQDADNVDDGGGKRYSWKYEHGMQYRVFDEDGGVITTYRFRNRSVSLIAALPKLSTGSGLSILLSVCEWKRARLEDIAATKGKSLTRCQGCHHSPQGLPCKVLQKYQPG
jgi:hypothetical protein